MTLIPETDDLLGPVLQVDLPDEGKPPGALDTLGAAFRLENTVGSALAREALPRTQFNPFFDPFDDEEIRQGVYANYADAFIFANSPEDVVRLKERIDRELKDRDTLQSAGVAGWISALAAGVLDPINLIPVGGAGARLFRGGQSILKGAAVTAGAGLTGATLAEATLHASQDTRTLGESALNIAGATFLSGVLGGAVGGISRRQARQAELDLTIPPLDKPDPLAPGAVKVTAKELDDDLNAAFDSTVGAARAGSTSIVEEKLTSTFGAAEAIAKLPLVSTPNLRMATSPALASRKALQELVESPLSYDKNALGIATPFSAEARVRAWDAPLAESLQELDTLYVRYKTGRDPALREGRTRTLEQIKNVTDKGGKLDFKQFKIEVGKAMRRGDKHEIPEVAQAAQTFRRNLLDPLKDNAIGLKMLPEDVDATTAESYLTRLWLPDQINARRPELLRRTEQWLGERETINSGIRKTLRPLLDEVREHQRAVVSLERRIERRQRTAEQVEARRQEASSLNRFAFRRSEKLSEPLDEIRADMERISSQIEDELEALAVIADDIAEVRADLPELVDVERQMQSVSRALSDINRRADLIDAVEAADEIDAGLTALADSFRAAQARMRETRSELRAQPEAEPLKALEKQRARLNKKIKPFQQELRRLRQEKAELEKQRKPGARGGAVFESQARRRVNTLSDQASGKRAAIEDLQRKLESRKARLEGARQAIEDEVLKFKGKSRLEAESAIRARETAAEGRDPGKPRLRGADRAVMRVAKRIAREPDLETAEIADIADQIADRLLGIHNGRIGYEPVPLARGPLRARTFTIPDEVIEDFLDSDIENVARAVTRTLAPDIELTRAFGDISMNDRFDAIREDYNKLFERVRDPKQRLKLSRRRDQDLEDLAAMRDRLRGIYGMPSNPNSLGVRTGRVIRQGNLLRLLGSVVISSVPDTGRTVMVEGLGRTMRTGLIPAIRNLKALNMSGRELRLAGTSWDMVLSSRSMSLADLGDDFGRHSKFERGLQEVTDNFGAFTLLNGWNRIMKDFSGQVIQTRMLEQAENWTKGRINPRNIKKLASQGIDENMARRIWRQFDEHGQTVEGEVRIANTEEWTDKGAVEAFRLALRRDVDRAIVTPGIGERPLWMSGGIGQMIGQFRSFTFAATQRVTLAALQDRDAAALVGLLFSVSMGMGVYYTKARLAGFAVSDDPAVWLTEGIDRSGVTGWLFDAGNVLEKTSRGRLGVNALVDGPPMSRYVSRNIIGATLGPSVDLVKDLTTVAGATASGDWSEGDVRAFRRLLPFQNIFYLRTLFDRVQEGIEEEMGVESDNQ